MNYGALLNSHNSSSFSWRFSKKRRSIEIGRKINLKDACKIEMVFFFCLLLLGKTTSILRKGPKGKHIKSVGNTPNSLKKNHHTNFYTIFLFLTQKVVTATDFTRLPLRENHRIVKFYEIRFELLGVSMNYGIGSIKEMSYFVALDSIEIFPKWFLC